MGSLGESLEGYSICLKSLCESVLVFRTKTFIDSLLNKLLDEGVTEATDLLRCSKDALQSKLANRQSFNFIEMADVVSLREALVSGKELPVDKVRKADTHNSMVAVNTTAASNVLQLPEERARSRSMPRGRKPVAARHDGQGGRGNSRRGSRQSSPNMSSKPRLWAAVEAGDQPLVRECLQEGVDPDERYLSWTPLMKAAEEDHSGILELLIEKRASLHSKNRKGRSALSFAAAPSMKRPTSCMALRILLQNGANLHDKDEAGWTAKQRAQQERRNDALEVFEEFEGGKADA